MSRFGLNDVLSDVCCVPSCGAKPQEDAPFPICMRHMRQVFDYFDGFAEMAERVVAARHPLDEQDLAEKVREMAHQEKRKADPDRDREQVYYVRTGDFIKIGFTVNVKSRMSAMRLPLTELLATEPGGRDLERVRHKQFAHLRDGRKENFRPEPELTDHVQMILRHFGAPRVTSWN